ncbi:amidase domain-containing protein [Brevibacillus sp. B_LB10_24]|uniref:amidase domain-containing protein n=1 Tax=Brevibacillus sp. B_LB10_24 TaxID=3380645 RepID=UPI0038B6DFBD
MNDIFRGDHVVTTCRRIVLSFICMMLAFAGSAAANTANVEDPAQFLERLFRMRTENLVKESKDVLTKLYLPRERVSRYALEHELRRGQYLKAWAAKRGVEIIGAESKIRVVRLRTEGNYAKAGLIQTLKITYAYKEKELAPQAFGIGTRHAVTLKQENGKWHVLREWYTDPMDEDSSFIPAASVQTDESAIEGALPEAWVANQKKAKRPKYNRKAAVKYADKYAGAAWGAGNNNRYNKKYLDYTYLGGDCTNYASQVIGDQAEGGGLPMRGGWYYRYKQGGSVSWVRTDAFKNFLLYSGYARLIARGSYDEVAKPTSRFPEGALAKLQPGDLIAYELGGDIDHFSVVTARDEKGYVLVNSHTGDRYHVPWDLGWDKSTKFWLIHLND